MFLHYHKLIRQANENTEEWMGRIRVAAKECNYKEVDRQFIHGIKYVCRNNQDTNENWWKYAHS